MNRPRQANPSLTSGTLHILGLQTFWTGLNFEFNLRALVERTIAVHLNCRKMNEHVFSGGPLNKTISLSGVEPLHNAFFSHAINLLLTTRTEWAILSPPAAARQAFCAELWPKRACPPPGSEHECIRRRKQMPGCRPGRRDDAVRDPASACIRNPLRDRLSALRRSRYRLRPDKLP